MTDKRDDRNLVLLLKEGNVVAFDSLFEVYGPKLFGFALKYFKNESDAEELVQEVFIKVWENRHSLKSEFLFKSYLFTIALNQIRKHFNKKATRLRYLESIQNEPIENEPSASEDNYESILSQINLIIDQMPARRREIFIKSKLEGKSSKEISAELNISAATVDNQVSLALSFIRCQLDTQKFAMLLFAVLFVY